MAQAQVKYVKESVKHETVRTASSDCQRLRAKLERLGIGERTENVYKLRMLQRELDEMLYVVTLEDRKNAALPH